MKVLVFIIYDAFGDWITANGMIRYLETFYDKIYLIHDTPVIVPFTGNMFRDNLKIIPIQGFNISDPEYDVIDLRVNDACFIPEVPGKYFNMRNKFGDQTFVSSDNASKFYSELGIDPKIRIQNFNYNRSMEKEEKLYNSLNLPKKYSVICEMSDNMIKRDYIKEDYIVNLHKLSDNFMYTLKVIENASEVHLIENSISLFVYHMQHVLKMKMIDINLHTYARQEPHRKCDNPNSNNLYLNMLKCPKLPNWSFI